jgi:hypothetical protein
MIMMTRLIALSFLASFMATTLVHAASAPKQTAPEAMKLRTQENICLAPLPQGVTFQEFVEIITDDQQKRTVAVSSEARLKRIFASIDLDANGVLNAAEVLGAKGGDDKYCGASCDSQTGKGCPGKCHCHRNEGRCAKDGY